MKRRILIVGGGYAGVLFANRLVRKIGTHAIEVVLANPRPWFVERVRLHEDVAGRGPTRRALSSMIDARIALHVGAVDTLDLTARRATFADRSTESFDELVLATGSHSAAFDVPGNEYAWSCTTEDSALALRRHLENTPGPIVVIGGGLTGTELATELAERYRHRQIVLIASDTAGSCLSDDAANHVRKALRRFAVDLHEHSRVVALEADGVILASGIRLASAASVWCGGLVPPPLAQNAGLRVDAEGRAVVDHHLQSASHDFVRVMGDAARVSIGADERLLRMACATALPQGAYSADDCADAIAGRLRRAFSFRYVGQCISLGRADGILQWQRPSGEPGNGYLGGIGAAWSKELVCRYAAKSPMWERHGLGYVWREAPGARLPAAPALMARKSP